MLGERIAELRKAKGISQEELADALMTSRQAISKWERGESDPDITRLKDLALYFEVSIDYLLGYDIETTSVNGFISRLKKCLEEEKYDVSLDEIKMIISRNNNNFNLLLAANEYLGSYYYIVREEEVIDLLIQYLKKAVLLFQPDNSYNCTLNDLHNAIAFAYTVKQRYDLAKAYLKDNQVIDTDGLMCRCEFELGNYIETERITSNIFSNSISLIVNSNAIQIGLFIRTNREKEAIEMVDWSINFIQSVIKDQTLLFTVLYAFTFIKTACQKELGLDYSTSLKYLLENREKTLGYQNFNDGLRFYNNQRVTYASFEGDVKKDIFHEIEKLKKGGYKYQAALDVYTQVYGGD